MTKVKTTSGKENKFDPQQAKQNNRIVPYYISYRSTSTSLPLPVILMSR